MNLLLAYLLGILTAVRSKRNNTSRTDDHAEERTHHADPDRPITIMCIPPSPSDEECANEKKQKRRKTITFWIEILGLLVLVTYAGFTIAIWYTMKRANDIAKIAYQSGQRAYIVYEDMNHTMGVVTNPMGKDTIVFNIEARMQNAGNTPAVDALAVIGASEQEEEITEQEFLGAVPHTLVKQPVASIGPKIPFGCGPVHVADSFADSTERPRYIWGWVLYNDIFPKTKPHVTEFCVPVTRIEKDDIVNYSFTKSTVCTRHNCIDEFCDDYPNLAALAKRH